MTDLTQFLDIRMEEYDTHMALAQALELRVVNGEVLSIGETELSARHLQTLKSGLIVHLYNIVEATMSRTMRLVGTALGESSPHSWNEKSLREWLRYNAVKDSPVNEETRLGVIHDVSCKLLKGEPLGVQKLQKPPGSWTDKLIHKFAERLGVVIDMTEEMWRQNAASPKYNDMSPMEFLADRRNAIAHGRRSFEEGASGLTLSDIELLRLVTFIYLEATVTAFTVHISEDNFALSSA